MVQLLIIVSGVLILTCAGAAHQAPGAGAWLDRPLANWNTPGAALPKAAAGKESRDDVLKRCKLTLRQSTPAERLISDAGWIPYLHFARTIAQGDTEILDGMS